MSTVLDKLPKNTSLRHGIWVILFVVVGFTAVYWVSEFDTSLIINLCVYMCAVMGLTVLVGGNGQISLGHAALMATGAYTVAKFVPTQADNIRQASLGVIIVGLLLAVVVTMIVGVVIGLAASRLHGPYLAGATLALGVALAGITVYFHDFLGGEHGVESPSVAVPAALSDSGWTNQRFVALIAVIAAAIVLFFLANLKYSGFGRQLAAVRDNEIAAQLCGVSVRREKVKAFVLSSATAGLAGGVLALSIGRVEPLSFSLVMSLAVLAAAVIGGLGSLRGAIWGTIIVVTLDRVFKTNLDLNDNAPAMAYGALLIVVILLAPGGIQSLLVQLGRKISRS
ncbi:branched-chain amino acid ABC transporter permease [Gordonia amarae]|uniref:Branched-chain amino acid ABC transporter permease n=2 Tax=Gordonia amarae TaxID=36821 RepID=A0A857L0F9_9ACTN|nr:branched-chain amino acid ABC transporter permease [Gordonia amarae]MCS3879793.1 branched-chain amino acid transport system permease protein [Gordonia amarae]QHN18220.1 branched-chain amino acid ABC transporter permease [Gordonia amarae]QHN22704.1 branched-chain amino acid ABC transporter permease [Gordonia amarae]QHN31607.1 branched-chain amino acid ABC transporter permease [Gordonia amarae]QHN40351.1 branched-chain amino acid ABC transporter permease [Gordonia amarae]